MANNTTDTLLTADSVDFSYPNAASPALSNLSLTIKSGEILGLLGPNGAGKTTFVSSIVGFIKLQKGHIRIDGKPASLGRRDIALVPQEYAFYEKLSVLENLNYFAGILGASPKLNAVLSECQLQNLASKRANALSGGEKRRLNLAITLLQAPTLLILDEPTANVDPESRRHILQIIRTLNERGVTIIYTSHLLDEVQALCSSVALINQGKLVLSGNLPEVLNSTNRQALKLKVESINEIQLNLLASLGELACDRTNNSIVFTQLNSASQGLKILNKAAEAGIKISSYQFDQSSLEELYLSNTSTPESPEFNR